MEAYALLDAEVGREEAVAAITRMQTALWGLDGSMCLTVARREPPRGLAARHSVLEAKAQLAR